MPKGKNGETMIISEIRAKKKGVEVLFQEGDPLFLSPDSFTDFRLFVGKEITPNEYSKLRRYAELDHYFSYALRLLSLRPYSFATMGKKLKEKGADDSSRHDILSRLKKAGLLDDEAYARNYVENAGEISFKGKQRILYELREDGISESILGKLSFPRKKELEKALVLGETLNRRYDHFPYAKKAAKMKQSLREKGFESEIIEETISRVLTEPDHKQIKKTLLLDYEKASLHYGRKYKGYGKKTRIYANLIGKGYDYDEVKAILEEKEK